MDSLLCLDIKPFNHTRISKEIYQMIGNRKVTDTDTFNTNTEIPEGHGRMVPRSDFPKKKMCIYVG